MREIVAVYVLDRGICQPTQDVGNEVLQDPVQILLRVNVPQYNRFFEIPSIEGDHKVVDDVFGEKTLLNQGRQLSLNQSIGEQIARPVVAGIRYPVCINLTNDADGRIRM